MNYLSYAEITLAIAVTCLASGWALGHYGVSTITAELNKVKADLENIKGRLFNAPQATTISTNPVGTTVTTN